MLAHVAWAAQDLSFVVDTVSSTSTTVSPILEESADLRQVILVCTGVAFLLIAGWISCGIAYKRGLLPFKPPGQSSELKIHVSMEECPEPGVASRSGPRMSVASRCSGGEQRRSSRASLDAALGPSSPAMRCLSDEPRRSSVASTVSRQSMGGKVPPRRSRSVSVARAAARGVREPSPEPMAEVEAPVVHHRPAEAWGPEMEILSDANASPIWIQPARTDPNNTDSLEVGLGFTVRHETSRTSAGSRRSSMGRTDESPRRGRKESLLSVKSFQASKASRVHPCTVMPY